MKNAIVLILALSLLLATRNVTKPHLEAIKERGELRVLSRYGLTSYYAKGDKLTGFEYELAQRFANRLNVKLKIIIPENLDKMFTLLAQQQADIAAAGLTVTPQREQHVRFGPIYHEVTQQLVYKHGNQRPRTLNDIKAGQLEVLAGSSHVEQLKKLQHEFPNLRWNENNEINSKGLLELVKLGLIDYTIMDSNEMSATHSLYPELRVAFDITEPQKLAWAVAIFKDNSLYREITDFFSDLEQSGELAQLTEKYYGHIRRFDYVDIRTIHRRIQTHLPKYESRFKQAAQAYHFDWKLLAAIAYQESHWNPLAISSTGVRGLMMLTAATARQMGVTDRTDPDQSIIAGTAYLAAIKKRLSVQIKDPDRTWFALAAYNVGPGHLEDARKLTKQAGKNMNLWSDVRQFLPLLSKKEWYQKTKHGYARGYEPVRYIENIRRYYDILLHVDVNSFTISPESDTAAEIFRLPAAL